MAKRGSSVAVSESSAAALRDLAERLGTSPAKVLALALRRPEAIERAYLMAVQDDAAERLRELESTPPARRPAKRTGGGRAARAAAARATPGGELGEVGEPDVRPGVQQAPGDAV